MHIFQITRHQDHDHTILLGTVYRTILKSSNPPVTFLLTIVTLAVIVSQFWNIFFLEIMWSHCDGVFFVCFFVKPRPCLGQMIRDRKKNFLLSLIIRTDSKFGPNDKREEKIFRVSKTPKRYEFKACSYY